MVSYEDESTRAPYPAMARVARDRAARGVNSCSPSHRGVGIRHVLDRAACCPVGASRAARAMACRVGRWRRHPSASRTRRMCRLPPSVPVVPHVRTRGAVASASAAVVVATGMRPARRPCARGAAAFNVRLVAPGGVASRPRRRRAGHDARSCPDRRVSPRRARHRRARGSTRSARRRSGSLKSTLKCNNQRMAS